MKQRNVKFNFYVKQVEDLESHGKTVMFMAVDGKFAGLVAVADTLKESSVEAVHRLKEIGLSSGRTSAIT